MNFPAETITEPTTAPSTSFTDFILAQLNCAALRSRIALNQIETATVALSAGIITPETAILILHETGLAGLIPTSSAVWTKLAPGAAAPGAADEAGLLSLVEVSS